MAHGGIKYRKRAVRATRSPKRAIRVKERKLGKHGALGLAHEDGLVEIDPRQTGKQYLDTMIHELLHVIDPSKEWPEKTVEKAAGTITLFLWKAGFRRIHD
jgi:hypothetical protein|tara:strand:- start:434 stop:736 length:303 start_codon:yes stop_codon:yes gene_type:complete